MLLLLGGVALLMKSAFLADMPVRAFILQLEGTTWEHSSQKLFFGFVSRYGDWPELMFLGIFGFLMARWCQSLKWQRVFLIAMIASTLAGAATNTLRLTTGRTRPRVSPSMEQAWYGPYHQGKWTIGHAEVNSFPSGHTATAFGFATVIFLASSFWGIPALLLASLIASSRLFLGAHHPSDLVAAILLSLGVVWVLWNYLKKNNSSKF